MSALDHQLNFVFVCLPQSRSVLYEWLEFLEASGEMKTTQQRRWNGRYFELWHYRYFNRVPLCETQPALPDVCHEWRSGFMGAIGHKWVNSFLGDFLGVMADTQF